MTNMLKGTMAGLAAVLLATTALAQTELTVYELLPVSWTPG